MKRNIYLFMLLCGLLLLNCKRITEPLSTQTGPDTSSHNFTWVVDTLRAPNTMQILISDIWGTDENNVWIVGHSDSSPYQIWHWNGREWQNIKPTLFGARASFRAITGFAADDIWIVGSAIYQFDPNPEQPHRRYILHYDGSEWRHFDDILAPHAGSVWGTSSDNLFVGCDSGIVLHKKGQVWEKQQLPRNVQVSVNGLNDQLIYATGEENRYEYIFENKNGNWVVLDSINYRNLVEDWHFGEKIWASPDVGFFSAGESGIFEYVNSSWKKLLDGRPFGPPFRSIYGSARNNLFAAALFNDVYHYNGVNWKRDSFFDNYYFNAIGNIWCTDDHVFISVRKDGRDTYIFRGVRKK